MRILIANASEGSFYEVLSKYLIFMRTVFAFLCEARELAVK